MTGKVVVGARKTWKIPVRRVWEVLNSNFAIFLLSAGLFGGGSYLYTQYQARQAASETRLQHSLELASELRYRILVAYRILEAEAISETQLLSLRGVMTGSSPYQAISAEFQGAPLLRLVRTLKPDLMFPPPLDSHQLATPSGREAFVELQQGMALVRLASEFDSGKVSTENLQELAPRILQELTRLHWQVERIPLPNRPQPPSTSVALGIAE